MKTEMSQNTFSQNWQSTLVSVNVPLTHHVNISQFLTLANHPDCLKMFELPIYSLIFNLSPKPLSLLSFFTISTLIFFPMFFPIYKPLYYLISHFYNVSLFFLHQVLCILFTYILYFRKNHCRTSSAMNQGADSNANIPYNLY